MAWYDDIWDSAMSAGSAVMGFAKANPTVAGAGAGLALHHLTGGKGEDNFAAAAGGAALGAGASYLTNGFTDAPSMGNWGGKDGAAAPSFGATSTSAPAVPTSNTATVGAGVAGDAVNARGGYEMGPAAAGNTGVTGDTGNTTMSKLSAGLGSVRKFAKDNEDVLTLGGKAVSAYMGNQAQQGYNNAYRANADAAMANNAINAGKKNAVVDQQVADYSAIDPQRAGKQAYATTLGRISNQAEANATSDMGRGYSASTVAANKRRGMIGASTGATTAAESARVGAESTRRAGLSSIQYKDQAVPNYDAEYAKSNEGASQGAYALFDDVTGLSNKKAKDQVGTQI